MGIEVGKRAPAFRLKDGAGKVHAPADYVGHDVVVYFYPQDDTPGCTKEAACFRDLAPDFARLGVVVLGVSPDDAASHLAFAAKHRLAFPLLSDPSRATMKKYDAFGEKVLYGKKVVGVIRSTVWIGPDGRVVRHWKRVPRAEDHPRKVLDAIEAARSAE